MADHEMVSVPTLDDIRERRRLAANHKQVVLARQANALKLYKMLSARLELFSEQEELLDRLEAQVIRINEIKEMRK